MEGNINVNQNLTAALNSNTTGINGQLNNNEQLTEILSNQDTEIGSLQATEPLNSRLNENNNIQLKFNSNRGAAISEFLYIMFSEQLPTTDTDMSPRSNENTQYMGICISQSGAAPSHYQSYNWLKIRGESGEKGEQGEVGPAGLDGNAYVNIVNPLYITGKLAAADWQLMPANISRTVGYSYYYQKIKVEENEFLSIRLVDDELQSLTSDEMIEYLQLKLSQNISFLVDLIVSDNIAAAVQENFYWKYIDRVYIEDNNGDLYINFECYDTMPTIDLNYQLKVI